ncbi:MAG: hypothetical protein U0L84_07110 [Acutalibacteraceae bacterium]|nr:hypothetical protein [Acutalibacteraceae bacterium]
MSENKNSDYEYDSFKDVAEFQNNMFNPGHYIGTGKVPPTVSAPGNATPLAIFCFLASVVIFVLGLFLFFSDVNVHSSGLIESPLVNKVITLIIMLVISLFFLLLGFGYLKKAKKYYREKTNLKNEETDETVADQIWQRKCPKCNKSHDIDYPKCPHCNFNYLEE